MLLLQSVVRDFTQFVDAENVGVDSRIVILCQLKGSQFLVNKKKLEMSPLQQYNYKG